MKLARNCCGSYERRGRVTGKRPISARPASVETRRQGGHWEVDTVLGTGDRRCVPSLVERTLRYLVLGKLSAHHRGGHPARHSAHPPAAAACAHQPRR